MPKEKDSWPGGLRGWMVSDPVKALSVAGVFTFGLLRFQYSLFYSGFGVQPEDLGIGYVQLLSQSATGLVIVLTVFYGVAVLGFAANFLLFRREAGSVAAVRAEMSDLGGRQRVAVVVGVLVVLVVVVGFLAFVPGWLQAAVLAVLAALALGRWWAERSKGVAPARQRIASEVADGKGLQPRSWLRPVLTWAAPVVVVGVVATLCLQAASDAAAVRRGEPRRPQFLGLPVASWGADVATLRGTDARGREAAKLLKDDCLMYLGQADGVLVLYDVNRRTTTRVQMDGLQLATSPERSQRCSG